MTDPATRYGHPLMEVPWRHGKDRKENIYAQHGPTPTDDDPWVALCVSPAVAGYLVRAHNQDVERTASAMRKR